jgi:predicted protein tyrosine phosphatase
MFVGESVSKMFIESIQRHLSVCGQIDLPKIAKRDPNFWNVISIREPARPPINPRGFKLIHKVTVYDANTQDAQYFEGTTGIPRSEHLEAIFRFADSVEGEPILVHCWAGVSRSTAVALSLIARGMHKDGFDLVEIRKAAPEILLEIRARATPNPLILELGLACFLTPEKARELAVEWVNHPVFFANRMGGEPSS